MTRLLIALLLALSLAAPVSAHKTSAPHSHASKKKCQSCPRDKHGKIKRSQSAKCAYLKQLGYANCRVPKGFVVDHSWPLCAGGLDIPANMTLQPAGDAKVKDQWERRICSN